MDKDSIDDEGSDIEQARKLLRLAEIVDKYPQVVNRRIIGITYVLIGGGISIATLVLITLMTTLNPTGIDMYLHLGFIGVSLLVTWVLAFRVVKVIAEPYQVGNAGDMSLAQIGVWVFFSLLIIIVSIISVLYDLPVLFPISVQIMISVGFISSYKSDTESPRTISREHLYFAFVALLTIIPMILFQSIMYVAIMIVDIGGIYILGIYFLISAEQVLLEQVGR